MTDHLERKEPEITKGYFEEYRCGCVSEVVRFKRELLGYCGKHGDSARGYHRIHPALYASRDEQPKKGE